MYRASSCEAIMASSRSSGIRVDHASWSSWSSLDIMAVLNHKKSLQLILVDDHWTDGAQRAWRDPSKKSRISR